MKTMLLAACSVIAMAVTSVQAGTPGPFAANTTFRMKLVSITKTESNQLKPKMKLFSGVPTGLEKGKTYEFKITSNGHITGPKGIDIAYTDLARLTLLNLAYLNVPGAVLYVDKKASGFMDLDSFIEFGTAYRRNNQGKPVSLSFSYIKAEFPYTNNKQVVFAFVKP